MINSLHRVGHLLPVLLALSLIACSQQQPVSKSPAAVQAMPFNIVSAGDSRANISGATTYSWAQGMQVANAEDPRLGDARLQAYMREAISTTMAEKGYQPAAADMPGDLQVGYIITLDNAGTDSGIADAYDVVQASINVPNPDPALYEKGTLVIDIIDANTGLTAWRSALQGFASFQTSEEQRRQRIIEMVQRMLSGLPARQLGR
jgi:phage tail protein X